MSKTLHPCWLGEWVTLTAAGLLVVFTAVACGADTEADAGAAQQVEFQKVTASERVYAIDDFVAFGFKKRRQYDVTELPGGVDAWMGYWGTDPYDRQQYELRFYASHGDATVLGPDLAREGAGEEAEAHRKNPTWKEGHKDRWQNVFVGENQFEGRWPHYGDYAILGNVIMLCEGADPAQGLERCEALANALTGQYTE